MIYYNGLIIINSPQHVKGYPINTSKYLINTSIQPINTLFTLTSPLQVKGGPLEGRQTGAMTGTVSRRPLASAP